MIMALPPERDRLKNYRSLSILRQNLDKNHSAFIETLSPENLRMFWKGSLYFLTGDNWQAAQYFYAARKEGLSNPLVRLQIQLQNNEEEERFLELLSVFETLYGSSSALIELRAMSLVQLHRLYEAESLIRKALTFLEDSGALKTILVKILCEQGAFGEALAILNALIAERPRDWDSLNNIGYIYNNTNEVEKALTLYRHAISIAPTEPLLRLNHSIALLKIGRFSQGWQEHEWRLKLPFHTSLPPERILPTLTPGTKMLQGKKVLITHEEGLGDAIMYARYIPMLAETGAFIHVWGSDQLSALTERIEGVQISQFGGSCPAYDYHCPFISLPRALTPYPGMPFTVSKPYLSSSPEKTAFWREKLSQFPPQILKIGLVWAGGVHPDDRSARLIDHHRSMDLRELEPLFDSNHLIQYFSLQKGPRASQQAAYSQFLIDYMGDCPTMEDTAAFIEALDLVITVDTAIVHLAGALGKETILMDRFCNCWRWGINQSETKWYPSVRIYRQPEFDDWQPVIHKISQELTERAMNRLLS